jgi:hypothetical protein
MGEGIMTAVAGERHGPSARAAKFLDGADESWNAGASIVPPDRALTRPRS